MWDNNNSGVAIEAEELGRPTIAVEEKDLEDNEQSFENDTSDAYSLKRSYEGTCTSRMIRMLTSNLLRKSLMPAPSPVRYRGVDNMFRN